MIEPGTSGSPENLDALPSRRTLRAQRAAAEEATGTTVVPHVMTDHAAVVSGRRAIRSAPTAPTAPVTPASRSSRSKRKNPITTAFTLIAIPALFLTTALPAYAFTPNSGGSVETSAERARTTAGAQKITVAAAAANVSFSRDSFTATTQEELTERTLTAQRAAAIEAARASAAEFAVRGVRAEGDDYPWPYELVDSAGGGLSPLGYYYRECVDFVAWRLNRDAGASNGSWRWTWNSLTPGGGNAYSWADAWAGHGWATSNTPVVGAVAWFNYNHVAYVQSVGADGSVVLEEYNWMGSHAYHTRTVAPSDVALYLYPPA
ncbi:CHAP domain-containing protein [Leifsonia sp. A12D58]|uniref:CHAP domain-containing protein n=1 Tax=Leifsonia sp. A12D58 TaxID=3397674 RepID=UPI0039E10716